MLVSLGTFICGCSLNLCNNLLEGQSGGGMGMFLGGIIMIFAIFSFLTSEKANPDFVESRIE